MGMISFYHEKPKSLTLRDGLTVELVGQMVTSYVRSNLDSTINKSSAPPNRSTAVESAHEGLQSMVSIAQSMMNWDIEAQRDLANHAKVLEFRANALADAHCWVSAENSQAISFRNIAEHAASPHLSQINLDGPNVSITGDVTCVVAVIVKELIYLKRTFNDTSVLSARVDVTWETTCGELKVSILDRGKQLATKSKLSSFIHGIISSTISSKLGGSLAEDASPEGVTTTFTISGSHVNSPDNLSPSLTTNYVSGEQPTVLLVEDNIPLQKKLSQEMTSMGYRVICADDVQDAEEVLNTTRIDALILDMFIESGENSITEGTLRIVSRIRNEINNKYKVDKDVPILAISGALGIPGGFSPLKMAKQIGVDACMPKPIDKTQLEEWLSQVRVD